MAVCRLFRALQVEVSGPNPEGYIIIYTYIYIWRCLFCFVQGRTLKWTKAAVGLPIPPSPNMYVCVDVSMYGWMYVCMFSPSATTVNHLG